MSEWTLIKKFRDGHRFFIDRKGRVSIADGSADYGPRGTIGKPDETDDGPLYLVPKGGRIVGESFDLLSPDGSVVQAVAAEEELAWLVVNYEYTYVAPSGVQHVIARLLQEKEIGHERDLSPRRDTAHSAEFWDYKPEQDHVGEWAITDAHGDTIAHTRRTGFATMEESNARLLAAAPKLKAFIQAVEYSAIHYRCGATLDRLCKEAHLLLKDLFPQDVAIEEYCW